MSTNPPPFNVREQARAARQQIKAQRNAFRAQRDFARMQFRSNRRTSIAGPLLLVGTGVVVLLVRMGNIPRATFLDLYSRWWPLLLVAVGATLLAEWAVDHQAAQRDTAEAPLPRRTLGGGTVFLLILLCSIGASSGRFHLDQLGDFPTNWAITPENFHEFFGGGEKHESTQTLEEPFPAGSSLVVDNPHGNVTITGKSDDNKLHITVQKSVYTEGGADSAAEAARLNPLLTHTGTTVSLSIPAVEGDSADLLLTVPDFAATTVTSAHGDVVLSALKAPVTVSALHGDLALNDITGNVSARMDQDSSSLAAHRLIGDLAVRGHASDVSITDVSGRTTLEGEFFSDTHVERLKGGFIFRTSRTQLSVERLNGELDISPHADLSASDLVGPFILRTRSRNITLDRVAGDVDVSNSHGSVDLTSVLPLGSISIVNKNGEVNVTVPDKSSFRLDAETKGGEIQAGDLNLHPSEGHNLSTLQTAVGTGGPSIMVRTTHLNIGLHRRSEAVAP